MEFGKCYRAILRAYFQNLEHKSVKKISRSLNHENVFGNLESHLIGKSLSFVIELQAEQCCQEFH